MAERIESPTRVVLRGDRGDVPAVALLLRGDRAVLRTSESPVGVKDHATVLLDWRDGSRTTLDGYVSHVDASVPEGTSTEVDVVGLDGDWRHYLQHVGDSILAAS